MKYEVTYTSSHTRAVEIGGIMWIPGEPQMLDTVPDEVLAGAEFGGHFIITEAKPTRRKKVVSDAGAMPPPDAPDDEPLDPDA